MLLELTNLHAIVRLASDEERAALSSYLSFRDESQRFFRRRDGSVGSKSVPTDNLYDALTDRFPAGLTSKVKERLEGQGFRVDVLDKRVRPVAFDPSADIGWLHDFQLECVRKFDTRTRGIAWLPTGAGKTEIAVATTQALPCNWLFVVNEKDLMHNAARRYEKRTKMTSGRVGDGTLQIGQQFTAATFQSLAAGIKRGDPQIRNLLMAAEGVFFDEVHTLPANSFYGVSQHMRNAYFRLGLSGTPLARGDQKSMFSVAATGEIIYRVEPQILIERGFISRPSITLVPFTHTGGPYADFDKAYRHGIVGNAKRNELIAAMAVVAPKPGLVFVKEKKHGHELVELLRKRGMKVEFVWGDKSTAQRDEAIRQLQWGNLDLIVCSVVFQTGTDIPELESITVGAGGKSVIAALQRIGRGMRVTRDSFGNVVKGQFRVYDVKDLGASGPKGQRWLEEHATRRFNAYRGEGYEVTIDEGFII